MAAQQQRLSFSRPIRGFSWLFIGAEEALLLGGAILLSWVTSSALVYALEMSLFLVTVVLIQALLAVLIFSRASPLRERLTASFLLLPNLGGIIGMIAVLHLLVTLFAIGLLILGMLLGMIAFPTYWWHIGNTFAIIGEDITILYPLALRAMAAQGKNTLKMRWFLAGWAILALGWLIGGMLDFTQSISPPRMILAGELVAICIILPIYFIFFHTSGRETSPLGYYGLEAWPFTLETDLEASICADEEWQWGAVWGKPRRGHPEGQVMYHIAEVLANVDRYATSPEERRNLRLIAIIHDTFKGYVDPAKRKSGENHHAMLARRFAGRYLDDPAVLEVIELHDEAFNSWRLGSRKRRWDTAEERADRLITRLGETLPLYVRFLHCDNETGSKEPAPVEWFEGLLRARGIEVAVHAEGD